MNIFFVDDEPLTLHYLEHIIDWGSLGLTVAGSAENGQDALEAFSRHYPDILITDIRMPAMDGIELIQAVRAVSDKVKIIVLSAYSDFEYARTVFGYGVSGYLIKPINEIKLEQLVAQAIQEIEATSLEREKSMFTAALAAETLLWEQITKPNSDTLFYEKFEQLETKPELSTYQLLSFSFSREHLTRNMVFHALQESSPTIKRYANFIIHAETNVWLLLLESQIGSQELYAAREHLRDNFDQALYVTVSAVHSGPASLESAYAEVKHLNALRFYSGQTEYVFFRKRPSRNLEDQDLAIHNTVDQTLKTLLSADIEEVRHYLEDLDEEIQEACGSAIDDYIDYWTLFLLFVRTRVEQKNTLIHMPEGLQHFDRSSFQGYPDSRAMQNFIMHCLRELKQSPVSVPDADESSVVSEVKQFIHTNYHEKLSLDDIAEAHRLSKNYLCRLFHEISGSTVWDYLTMVRIEHAKELLNGNKSTAEIANLVGYDNQGYFSSVFKKKTGMSPRHYRKQINDTKLRL
ncbi:MAG: response regulator transcription factor [Spirochaetota bacterium]